MENVFDDEEIIFVHRLDIEETIQECTIEDDEDDILSLQDTLSLSQISECESVILDHPGILSPDFGSVLKYCNLILETDSNEICSEVCQ